ncbi:alpha/beta hydrolase [Pelagibius sp. CAU 1746]|uniref:alpha/beta fold hydrolase n=1 Tax=Pelagibius sp. CAU 1746 TaxID=3140370 RepID=UPI00325AF5A8
MTTMSTAGTPTHPFPAGQVSARWIGNDLPVVALHSSASTGGQWRSLVECFAGKRQVVTPDLPGYGFAAAPEPHDRADCLAAEAAAVLRAVGPSAPAFHLVGHSYGGAVALKIALAYPWRVRSLTLIEPVVFHLLPQGGSDADKRLYRGVLGVRDRLRGAVAAGWPAYGMAAFVDFWNGAGTWDRCEAAQRQRLSAQARAVMRNFASVLGETWPLSDLTRLAMPLLTVTGETSPEVGRRVTDKLVDAAPEVTAARVFGAGHMAPLTHAEAVNTLIERHVDSADALAAASRRASAA